MGNLSKEHDKLCSIEQHIKIILPRKYTDRRETLWLIQRLSQAVLRVLRGNALIILSGIKSKYDGEPGDPKQRALHSGEVVSHQQWR